jgi:hypothetical protein
MTITVEDPNIFKKPWSMSIEYGTVAGRYDGARQTPSGFTEEDRCTEDNRAHAKLIPLAPIPDF